MAIINVPQFVQMLKCSGQTKIGCYEKLISESFARLEDSFKRLDSCRKRIQMEYSIAKSWLDYVSDLQQKLTQIKTTHFCASNDTQFCLGASKQTTTYPKAVLTSLRVTRGYRWYSWMVSGDV